MSKRYASISAGPPGWITVTFTYDEDVKDELRYVTGQGNYRWMPTLKAWLYRSSLKEEVLGVFREFGYKVQVHLPTQNPPRGDDCRAAWDTIFCTIPEPLDRKLYRAAMLALHPDQGGNTASAQELNLA
jgi:hypothetical protein